MVVILIAKRKVFLVRMFFFFPELNKASTADDDDEGRLVNLLSDVIDVNSIQLNVVHEREDRMFLLCRSRYVFFYPIVLCQGSAKLHEYKVQRF